MKGRISDELNPVLTWWKISYIPGYFSDTLAANSQIPQSPNFATNPYFYHQSWIRIPLNSHLDQFPFKKKEYDPNTGPLDVYGGKNWFCRHQKKVCIHTCSPDSNSLPVLSSYRSPAETFHVMYLFFVNEIDLFVNILPVLYVQEDLPHFYVILALYTRLLGHTVLSNS